MTNEQMALSALDLAGHILREARRYKEEGVLGLAIRRSQEVVELSLKGLLRFSGLEVPKIHDVGGFLRRHRDRLHPVLVEQLDSITKISRTLREEREIAFYGDEETGFAPEDIYTSADAEEALLDAEFVYDLCQQVVKGKALPES
jgi:HEPN domain-containing protein